MKFSLKDFLTFPKEILNGKPQFSASVLEAVLFRRGSNQAATMLLARQSQIYGN